MAPRLTSLFLLLVFSAAAQDNHQAQRLEWFYSQRSFPSGVIPPGVRRKAILEIDRMDAAARVRRQAARSLAQGNLPFALTTDASTWKQIGPRPTDPSTAFTTSGRVSALAVDPRDNNVVYLGAAEGGIWKTTDGGVNWTPLTDNEVTLATGSIALDPQNPDIVYVGTGEGNFNGDGYFGAGILKSTDGGSSWTNILGPFTQDYIGAIAVSPTDSQVVMCASRLGGIWRSADGGNTWRATLTGNSGTAVVFDPANGSSVYAALGTVLGNSQNGVYHSGDGGLTWQRIGGSGSAALPTSNVGRIDLALAPSAPATIYAQIATPVNTGNSTGALLGIYKTTDAGATWTRMTTPTQASAWGPQVWYYDIIRVSPQNPNIVWSGGISIFRSLDGGATWTQPSLTGPNGNNMHVDFHALAFTPDGTKLYIGNDGGAYSTTDISGTRPNWTALNDTLAITQFYPGMSMDPGTSGVGIAGAQDNGTQLYDGSGNWENVTCGDGGFTILDPSFPSLAYGACQRIQILRSLGLSGTSAWMTISGGIDPADNTQFISPFVADPSNPQTIYFGTFRVWQSRDGGFQWSAGPDLTGGPATLKSIAVAPSDSNTIYAGTNAGKVQVTTEALKGASAAWNERSAGLPGRTVTAIAVDPLNPATAYLTVSGYPRPSDPQGHVFKTTNGGANWSDISGDLPAIAVSDLILDPDQPDTLYIATDAGVMMTTNGGAAWSSLGSGLPKVAVMGLVMNRRARVLRAGTHGRSAWEIAIPISGRSLQPVIDSLSPATVETGSGSFVLGATGSNFVPGTVIRWNGQNRSTTFVDSEHVTAAIPAEDVASPGRAAVLAFNASTGGGLSTPKNFNIGTVRTSSSAFVSAANPTGGSQLAQRSIASLYGVNLANGVVAAGTPPLPIVLGGATLSLNGVSAPLFFVSPGQINFQVPLITTSISGPTTFSLTITQGVQSVTVPVVLKPFAPSLFTMNAQGTGQAAAVIANTATIAAPVGAFSDSRPAKVGDFVSIYCTGLGDVTNRPPLGAASPSSPLSLTQQQPVVTIGGVRATVQFSGLAPGFVGLYQVNVEVPAGVAAGDAVPIGLSIGGVTANTATIAVGQ